MTTVTQKKTEITTSSTGYEDRKSIPTSGFMYTSRILPRGTVTTRTSRSSGNINSGVFHTYDLSASMPVSGAFNLTSTSVHNVKANREREKQDLRDLNERFANYIEKVRFLEAQNKKLAGELEELKSKWGKETSAIKEMYETELEEARKLIDATNKEKVTLDVRVTELIDQLERQQKEYVAKLSFHILSTYTFNSELSSVSPKPHFLLVRHSFF